MLSEDKRLGGALSEYEKWRLEKIKKNKELLDSLFPDLNKAKEDLRSSLTVKRKERRRRVSSPYTSPGPLVVRRNPGREARNSISHCPPGAIISQSTDAGSLDYFDTSKIRMGRRRSRVKLEAVDIILGSDEEGDEDWQARMRELTKPVYHVVHKVYDRTRGTTCHQCRQKTLDGKTRCNNKNCVGVRGQFCGVCLLNRYGEDAETAINDKKWVCPPCKGYCNCSMCRTRKGKAPTGILLPIARAQSFNSVKDYLASFDDEDDAISDEETLELDDENKENIDPAQTNTQTNTQNNIKTENEDKENLPMNRSPRVVLRVVLRDARINSAPLLQSNAPLQAVVGAIPLEPEPADTDGGSMVSESAPADTDGGSMVSESAPLQSTDEGDVGFVRRSTRRSTGKTGV